MRRWRDLAAALGAGLALCVMLWGLRQFSTQLALAHIAHQAAARRVAIAHGQPVWRWRPRVPDDLIAGRAFGAATLAAGSDGVRLHSRDGTPYEVGLRLAQPVDLGHWPILRIRGSAGTAGMLGLVYQAPDGRGCRAPDAVPVAPGDFVLAIDLRRLAWQAPDGTNCTAPGIADMLRLRPHWPAGGDWTLREVAAWPAPDAPVRAARMPGQLPDLLAAPPGNRAPAAPVLSLPPVRAERLLAWRDAALLRWPGAILAPTGRGATGATGWTLPSPFAWSLSALYVAGLLLLGRRRRERSGGGLRVLDLAGVLAGPLWLITGLQLGTSHAGPAAVAFAAALLYAIVLEWRSEPAQWQWLGDWRRHPAVWLPVPAAALLGLLFGDGWHMPPVAAILAYPVWACIQQWLLLVVVMRRFQRLRQPALAVLATATVFALLHTPNGTLMQLCLLAECWWAACFIRQRALLPVALSHAAAALLLAAGLSGGTLLRSLEVGARFFH